MVGLIGRKVGMTQVFTENGELMPATVIKIDDNIVVQKRTAEKNGYSAIVVGVGQKKKSRIHKPFAGQFSEGLAPTKCLKELRDFSGEVAIGDTLNASIFEGVRFVDVIATSKGKGFQGVVKRWGFKGGRATHGSKFHREPGSTGQSTFPHHTFKNVKLPGRMGRERVTAQNLRLIRIDPEKKWILVRGAVPGHNNCMVVVRDSVKKRK